jgi:hypothetical protein
MGLSGQFHEQSRATSEGNSRNTHEENSQRSIDMKTIERGISFRSASVLIATALASTMLVGGSTALASGGKAGGSADVAGGDKKPVFVSGNSTASDCGLPGSDWAISLTGDLKGCWSGFIQDSTCKALQDYDLYL